MPVCTTEEDAGRCQMSATPITYISAPHSSALQTNTTKFKQDFIGPLFIDTALDKTHYRLKDATRLLLDGMYHVSQIKKGSAHILQGIVSTFDG